jgi:hypothetical protein
MKKRATTRKSESLTKMGSPMARVAYVASPLGQVESLIGAMANPESGIKFVLGIAKRAGQKVSEVQSVLFDRMKWTVDGAKDWLHEHGFTSSGKDEGATFWRFRQSSPGKYKEFRTVVPGTRNPRYEHPAPKRDWKSEVLEWKIGPYSDFDSAYPRAEKFKREGHRIRHIEPEYGAHTGNERQWWIRGTSQGEIPEGAIPVRPGFENPDYAGQWTNHEDAKPPFYVQVKDKGRWCPMYGGEGIYADAREASRAMVNHANEYSGKFAWRALDGDGRVFDELRARAEREANSENPALQQVQGRDWIQETYESASTEARGRGSQLRKLGYRVNVSSMGMQVTPLGLLKLTMVDVRPGESGDVYLERVPPPTGGIVRMNPDITHHPPSNHTAVYFEGKHWGDVSDREWPEVKKALVRQGWKQNGFKIHAGGMGMSVNYVPKRGKHPAVPNPRPIVVVHIGTGVKVGDFDTREEAQRWIDNLGVTPSYKEQSYRIKTAQEWWASHPSNRGLCNPESAAADLYEEFHGQAPGETLAIVTERKEHEWLTQLGTLVELKVETLTKLDAMLRFSKEAPELCSSEDGRQLYIEGGDQALDLKALKMDSDKWVKDSMTIGVLVELTYRTKKGFHRFKTTDYFHKLGEESGIQPYLLYDSRNKLLSISGGAYRVEEPGIID